MVILLDLLEMRAQLLNTNSLMIVSSLLVTIVDRSKTLEADPAVESTLAISAYKLVAFAMFEAVVKANSHVY